jgi:hypothetical protein
MWTNRCGIFRVGAAWIAALTIITTSGNAVAQEWSAAFETDAPAWSQLADVEQLFWVCDYVATTRGVDAAPVDACSAATEELKNVKFEGDFMALLSWWRDNKPEQHARLARLVSQAGSHEEYGHVPACYPTSLSVDQVDTCA